MPKKIAILTGGGDCPGLNAVIRAVARKSFPRGYELVGALEGWRGMLEPNFKPLGPAHVSGILQRGGTIIGTSRTNPYNVEGGVEKLRKNFSDAGLDALVAIGGEDTLGAAEVLSERGIPVVGIPTDAAPPTYTRCAQATACSASGRAGAGSPGCNLPYRARGACVLISASWLSSQQTSVCGAFWKSPADTS